ncbi:MAG: hypothetical protein FWE84_05340 [Firmicutes bacterium]|nr:hypothetical protein [Bacillota bacterium]
MKGKKSEKIQKPDLTPKEKKRSVNVRILMIIWVSLLALIVGVIIIFIIIMNTVQDFDMSPIFHVVTLIISFATFTATSIFSLAILNHNATSRNMNEEIQKNSCEANARAEAFRTLQFIASNYTIIDFVDYMLIYEEPDNYKAILKKTKDFTFYLREDNVDVNDIIENFADYKFVTIKLPIATVEGKTIGKIKFARFKFVKSNGEHRFVPCGGQNNSLIINNEKDNRAEAVVNLIMKKSSDFFRAGEIVPFSKIKISVTMQSLLGVAVKGWIELYFTNPLKLEDSGASKYKINSSQFEISGLPVLQNSVGEDIKST